MLDAYSLGIGVNVYELDRNGNVQIIARLSCAD